MPPRAESPLQTFDGARVRLRFTRRSNEGAPLLLLHGVTRRGDCFSPLWEGLTPYFQVLAADLRGHGASDRAPGAYRVVDYVEDVVALLRAAFEQPVVVYGHSLGAMVALAAAARAPDRVRAIVLEDPPFHTMGTRIGATPWRAYFEGLQNLLLQGGEQTTLVAALAELPVIDPRSGRNVRLADLRNAAALAFSAASLLQVDPEVLTPVVDGTWLDGYDMVDLARRVRCPALVLQADPAEGGCLVEEDRHTLSRSLSCASTVRLSGLGHLAHWGHPGEILAALATFFESFGIVTGSER